MITKKDLMNVLPISSEESYFLSWASNSGIPDGFLYGKSFIPFYTLLADFINNAAEYKSYDKIERVTETAKRYGLIDCAAYKEIDNAIINEAVQRGDLILFGVNDEFFDNCAIKPRSKDRYICINDIKAGGEYLYINQFPLFEGKSNLTEMQSFFSGQILIYKSAENFNGQIFCEDENSQFDKIILSGTEVNAINSEPAVSQLRDCVALTQITRRRIQSWLRFVSSAKRFNYDESIESFFDDYFHTLYLFYIKLETACLRNKALKDNPNDIVNGIAAFEKKLSQLVRMRRTENERANGF